MAAMNHIQKLFQRSTFQLIPKFPSQFQVCSFSKYYGNARRKRLPLTTKRARKGYYKGNGCRSEGSHTSKGGFIVDKSKQLELVIPNLTGFKLKPYVANATPKETYPLAAELFAKLKA